MAGRCELCGALLDEDTMVSHGEFFVCEQCDDASDNADAPDEPGAPSPPRETFVVKARVVGKLKN